MDLIQNYIEEPDTYGPLCRCCLIRPPDKDLKTTYRQDGNSENYANMLEECFDLHIETGLEKKPGICEDCIMHLRDACEFKQQVQKCQQDFWERIEAEIDIKDEPIKEMDALSVCNVDKLLPVKKEEVTEPDDSDTRFDSPTEDNIYSGISTSTAAITETCSSTNHSQEIKEEQIVEESSKKHVAEDIDTGTTKCRKKYVKKKKEIQQKKYQHTNKPNYKCNECDYENANKNLLVKHIRYHNIKRQYICDHCGYQFKTKYSLKRHIQRESKRREAHENKANDTSSKHYTCSFCNYKCKYIGIIKVHERTHTGEKPFICSFCGYRSTHSGGIKNHERRHTGDKPLKCNFCDYRSATNSGLKIHERIHTGEKPFKCKFCDYRSAESGKIKRHERTHTGEKPFKCKVCDYRSADSGKIKLHQRRHTGEKPFQCKFCDYRSTDRGKIKVHERTHTGEKPFKCKFCDYKSAESGKIKIHERSHTVEKPFKCNLCDYTCAQKGLLKNHKRKHTAPD